MEKYELGLKKKSFSLFYKGGEIWCEHLDSLYDRKDLMREKLTLDIESIRRPSTTGHIIIVLDETAIGDDDMEFIWSKLNGMDKTIRKLAFTGLDKYRRILVMKKSKNISYPVNCFDDLEKAKEWVMG